MPDGDGLGMAWRGFVGTRDAEATVGPPPADRDDLAAAWAVLTAWAVSEGDGRRAARDGAANAVAEADRATAAVRDRIAALFAAAGAKEPQDDPARAAAIEVERAEAALRRVEERRAQAA